MSEAERLVAFEAAMEELSTLQDAAARYARLRDPAAEFLGELTDLGRTLRRASRSGVFAGDAVEQAAERVRRLRGEWRRRLQELRESPEYRRALEAYAADDQAALETRLPELFTGLENVPAPVQLYQPISLTGRRRAGGSPFRPPEALAADLAALRTDGLRPRPRAREWWDTDLPALVFTAEIEAIDEPAALRIERLPAGMSAFREGDSILVFTPCLRAEISVLLAETSDDQWYEAAEGSHAEYRDAVLREVRRAGLAAHVAPAWS